MCVFVLLTVHPAACSSAAAAQRYHPERLKPKGKAAKGAKPARPTAPAVQSPRAKGGSPPAAPPSPGKRSSGGKSAVVSRPVAAASAAAAASASAVVSAKKDATGQKAAPGGGLSAQGSYEDALSPRSTADLIRSDSDTKAQEAALLARSGSKSKDN